MKRVFAMSLLLVFLLAACNLPSGAAVPQPTLPGATEEPKGEGEETVSGVPAELVNTNWQLVSLNGQSPLEEPPITLEIDDTGISGHAGCNGYGYASTPEQPYEFLKGDIAITAMACVDEAVMEQESAYMDMLWRARDYRLSGGQLELLDEQGNVLLVYEPVAVEPAPTEIVAGPWRLESFIEGETASSTISGSEVTLNFEGEPLAESGRVSGKAGCNQYFAHYTFDGEQLSFEAPGATKMFCNEPQGVMDQETRFLSLLAEVQQAVLDESGRLHLLTGDGRELVFVLQS